MIILDKDGSNGVVFNTKVPITTVSLSAPGVGLENSSIYISATVSGGPATPYEYYWTATGGSSGGMTVGVWTTTSAQSYFTSFGQGSAVITVKARDALGTVTNTASRTITWTP